MPELPEVETVCRGVQNALLNSVIKQVILRRDTLRWPIPTKVLRRTLPGQTLISVNRRAKYLLLGFTSGNLIIHLGMSGVLKVMDGTPDAQRHDHVDFIFDNIRTLRYHDPRRFGAILWTDEAIDSHKLIVSLGPEPLDNPTLGHHFVKMFTNRRVAIKNRIMDSHVVVGVGNIYASEILFRAGIHPEIPAGVLDESACHRLAEATQWVLKSAIAQGGTTLKDYRNSQGKPGYFQQELAVYKRDGQSCNQCGSTIVRTVMSNRATYFCPTCQTTTMP
ncbi:MAG: bifunctional DNA-formamidopyrimidine glycosylase/DNA-(apurinic or apyrimidinic site) lyase [Magnetococcales bacterium]|nr:bifunctional DNA-formamidopyrimidine glycosylase/DNA-(apurinic or apyrimidinic site) lyase [Magnetococcales bacterium]